MVKVIQMYTNPLKLKYPIVLVHGLGAKGKFGPIDYFYGIPKLLRNSKNSYYVANLTSFHTIEHRAEELTEQINQLFPDQKVNLIGHSFGGLDARHTATQLGSDRIASVTTIGTPNRGSIIADLALGLVPNTTLKLSDKFLSSFKLSTQAYEQITTKYCNEVLYDKIPDVRNIAYFSATSVIRNPVLKTALPLFWIPHKIVKRYEGENDGFISEHSAKWGEHICTYFGDHYGQIGQFLGYSRGLDHLRFFEEILTRLRREGM